jgi:hypothetical protein
MNGWVGEIIITTKLTLMWGFKYLGGDTLMHINIVFSST